MNAQKNTVSGPVLAKVCNLSVSRILQLVTDGIIPPPPARGEYLLWDSIHAYIAYLQRATIGLKKTDTSAVTGAKMPDPHSPRARAELAKAEMAEIELAQKRGELVPLPVIATLWDDMALRVRTKVQTIPHKAAPLLAGKKQTAPQIKKTLQTLTDEILHEIADYDAEAGVEKALDALYPPEDGELPPAAPPDGEPVG